jgi:hypothetical protein
MRKGLAQECKQFVSSLADTMKDANLDDLEWIGPYCTEPRAKVRIHDNF